MYKNRLNVCIRWKTKLVSWTFFPTNFMNKHGLDSRLFQCHTVTIIICMWCEKVESFRKSSKEMYFNKSKTLTLFLLRKWGAPSGGCNGTAGSGVTVWTGLGGGFIVNFFKVAIRLSHIKETSSILCKTWISNEKNISKFFYIDNESGKKSYETFRGMLIGFVWYSTWIGTLKGWEPSLGCYVLVLFEKTLGDFCSNSNSN